MLLIFVVIVLNLVLGFAAAVVLGYGPPGLAEIWVAASGEIAGHRQEATEIVSSQPVETTAEDQPDQSASADRTAHASEQPSNQLSDQPEDHLSTERPAEATSLSSNGDAQPNLTSGVAAESNPTPSMPLPSADELALSESPTATA